MNNNNEKNPEKVENLKIYMKNNAPFSEIRTINFFRQVFKSYEDAGFLGNSFDIKKTDITVTSAEETGKLQYNIKFNLQDPESKSNDAFKIALICLEMLNGSDGYDEKKKTLVIPVLNISKVFQEILEKVLLENSTFLDLQKTYFFSPFLKSENGSIKKSKKE